MLFSGQGSLADVWDPALKLVYPPLDLSHEQSRAMFVSSLVAAYLLSLMSCNFSCFSAFPDSNCFTHGDLAFSFRVEALPRSERVRGSRCVPGSLSPGSHCGFTVFRQVADATNKRGVFQVVFLSRRLTNKCP